MILLTHAYFINEDEKEAQIMRPYAPLGLLYISAYLTEKNIPHNVFDSTFSSFEALTTLISIEKPAIIGVYTNLMTKLNVLRLIKFIKEHQLPTKVILGGPEIRYNAEDYINNGADILVIGEGEQTFYELCKGFVEFQKIDKTIAGIAFLEKNTITYTAERALIKDINTLPFPARNAINLKLYGQAWKQHHGYSMYSVSTMRGCPYTCKWCSRAVYGGTYRRRSPKLVVDEIEFLKNNYNPDRIWFVDDVFTINPKWLREFEQEVTARNIIIPYEIITRADRMNEETILLLKKSGCFRVWIGAESGSQSIIDGMDRRVSVQKTGEMILLAKQHGIEAGTFIMLGYPGETKSDIKQTIQHLIRSNPSFYTITVAYPIKGTPLYNEIEDKLTTTNIAWNHSTDRDRDFKRTHSKAYYEHAVSWVNNTVELKTKSHTLTKRTKLFLNANWALLKMTIEIFK